MSQQKPRDNSMYNLSDCTNLDKQDKALKGCTTKYGVFGHTILTRQERKMSKTAVRGNNFRERSVSTHTDDAIKEIWQSFTVPIKFRIPSRHKSTGRVSS